MSNYKEEILNLRRQGKTYNEIAQKLGCSKSTVSYNLSNGSLEKRRARSRKYRTEKLTKLNAIKESKPCTDCGEYFEGFLMDFDHLPEYVKVHDIAWLLRTAGWHTVEAELEKCEVVCCMCHRKRTRQRWMDNPLKGEQ